MRTPRFLACALAALLAVAVASSASAASPRVEAMVVGRSAVLQPPTQVSVPAARVKVGRKSCAIAAGTPLGVLVALRRRGGPSFHLRDFGSCSRRAADANLLFVDKIDGERNAGSDGWVYKVGNRAGTTDAADPKGPFGTGRRLRSGQKVLWFWCTLSAGSRCPPTLSVGVDSAKVAPGAPIRATVTAYDDNGHGTLAAGATVSVGGASATAGPDGSATVPAPTAPGTYDVTAREQGAMSGFPASVEVG
jgi:hypothetical protein